MRTRWERAGRRATARLPWVCAAVAAATCVAPAGTARAEDPTADRPVRIAIPKRGTPATKAVVPVRIRAVEPVRNLRVSVVGERHADVTERLRAPRRGVWHTRLRVGRELATGRNQLFVRARTRAGAEDVVARQIVVAPRRSDLVEVRRPRIGSARAPVVAGVALARGRLRVRLNGRNARGAFDRLGSSDAWRARLTVHDGLRFGRNRLLVTAFTGDGSYDRVLRRFVVRRRAPLADAGRDRTVQAGRPVRLNGRSTRGHRRGARLALRWRVVGKPRGSRPRLRRARSARPRLVADVEGDYTIALRARARPGRRGRAGRSAVAPGTSVDTVTVSAQPAVLPSGMPLEVLAAGPDGPGGPTGVQLAGDFHPATGAGPQLLALDRRTLAVTASQTMPAGDAGVDRLAAALGQLSADDLAIVTGGARESALSAAGQQRLTGLLLTIGAAAPDGESAAALASGEWSVVGIPGLTQGQAYQLVGRQQGADGRPGAMSGLLRLDSQGNFGFAWPPEHVTFDTRAPGSTATENVISVAGRRYPSWSLAAGQSGVQVLWLDADTLELRGTFTYRDEAAPDGTCPPPGEPQCLWDFVGANDVDDHTQLDAIAGDPDSMLVLATIGNPDVAAAPASWSLLAQRVPEFGANPQIMLGLDGKGDYSLVGVNGLGALGPNRGAEVSQAASGLPTARLAGVLERNRQGLLAPAGHGSPGPGQKAAVTQPGLQQLLAQPAQPFPAFDGPGQAAAERYVAAQLGLPLDPAFGIRANYWLDDSVQWGAQLSLLESLDPCSASPCARGFASVRRQLAAEMARVDTVREYFTGGDEDDLAGLLRGTMLTGSLSFTGIGERILSFYDPPPTPAQGPNALGILQGSLSIASGVGGAVPGGGALAAPFKIAAGVTTIIQAVSASPGGSSFFDPSAFRQAMGSFATKLGTDWAAGLDGLSHVADLLVSDWGRLQAAARRVDTPAPQGGWGLDTQSQAALASTIRISQRRYMWSSMLPVPLVVGTSATDPMTTSPHPPAADVFQLSVPVGSGSKAKIERHHWFPCRLGAPTARSNRYPDPQILDILFDSPADGGLGFEAARFLAAARTGPGGAALTPGFVHFETMSFADGGWCVVGE